MSKVTPPSPTGYAVGQIPTKSSSSAGARTRDASDATRITHHAGATRAQARDGVRASIAQPGWGTTPEDVDSAVRHAKMEAAVMSFLEPLPKPDTMAFNEAQKRHWRAHTQTGDSREVQRARMLAFVAEQQANAGVRFDGQLRMHEALTLLSDAQKLQSSQALRLQNPLGAVFEMARDTVDWATSLFSGRINIHDMNATDFANRVESSFITGKSPAFKELENAGGKMRNVVIVLLDADHVSEHHFLKTTHFVDTYFDARKGDFLLLEGIAYKDGHQVTAEEASHHCFGVPASCALLVEPDSSRETARLSQEVNKRMREAWDSMLPTISKEQAAKAIAEHTAYRASVPRIMHADKDLLRFLHRYMENPLPGSEFSERYQVMQDARSAYTESQDQGLFDRNRAYWNQIEDRWMRLNGANMMVSMGLFHGPNGRGINLNMGRLPPERTNPVSDYKQDKIPVFLVYDRKDQPIQW